MAEATTIHPLNFTLDVKGATHELHYKLDSQQMSHGNILKSFQRGKLYEETLSRFLMRVLDPGDTFIDIGAHVGFFSIMAAHLVGDDGKVVSFEPNADNYAWLQDHIRLNKKENVTAINAVACDTDGTVDFYTNADNDGGHALWDPGLHNFNVKSKAEPIKVTHDSERVDTVADRLDITTCKAVKIDTEGAEVIVLKSGDAFFVPERVPYVVCEMNEFGLKQMGADQWALRQHMKDKGYSTFIFQEDDKIPVMVPDNSTFYSKYIFNVLFSTPDAIGKAWPQVVPMAD